MAPRETSRRALLVGAGGVGASVAEAHTGFAQSTAGVAPAAGGSAAGIPGVQTSHELRWQYEADGDETVCYPLGAGHGAAFAFVYAEREEGDPLSEVRAFDRRTGDVRWSHEAESLPAVASGPNERVYVGDDGGVAALDAADGSVTWTHREEATRTRQLKVDDGSVFAVADGDLLALDAADGRLRWRTAASAELVRGLLLTDDSVIFGGRDGFAALRRSDGRRRWHEPVEEGAAWPAAIRGDLLVGWSESAVYGVALADGARRFRTRVGPVRPHTIGGAVDDDSAYVWTDRLVAVDFRTGKRRWVYDPDESDAETVENPDIGGFMPVVSGGRVYTSTQDAVVALDADTGRERWQYEVRSRYFGYWGRVAHGHVYVADDRTVRALAADTGREEWSLDADAERTLWIRSAGDLVVVGTRSGRFYAIDPPARPLSAPLATAAEFATSAPGVGLLGLVGAGLLAAGYRRATRDSTATAPHPDADAELGRLARLGGGPVTETHLKRVRTPDGPTLVAETRLTDARHREEFARAVERWSDVDAEGVLPIREYGAGDAREGDAMPWFETPYLAGGSLADSWPLARRERVEVVSGAARALHAAHRREVVHGRLAPRHVLRGRVAPDSDDPASAPEVAVGGWFLADALAPVRDDTDPSNPVREPDPYAPPENSSDVAADVYRVGALASDLLGGGPPTRTAGEPPLGSTATDSLSGRLGAVLDRALAADPADRYESALAFDDAFRWAALDR
ncbi:outer membrane protein assembly factor BamB family protein [Halorussus salinus]|uniref:outer membrane protein assembly factor BamB family protein n=1 Tax=Halorussus salinus TaxID=1364935 RepID=UPI001091D611|nr:PQQ-binding-like beta-propeller repeat protein [Halorussus salinus]